MKGGIKQGKVFQKAPPIILLSIMYVFIGFFTENKIVNPFQPNEFLSQIELIVPLIAVIIFGGIVGGGVGTLGYLLLVTIRQLSEGEPIDISIFEWITASGYFIAYLILEKLILIKQKKISVKDYLFAFYTWYRFVVNIVAGSISISLIAPLTIAILHLIMLEESFDSASNLFLELSSSNFIICLTILPITLLLYDILELFRIQRESQQDSKHKILSTKVLNQGSAEIDEVYFDQHAFRVGHWTPLHIRFKHTWKASRAYEIEVVSTSRMYPHIDSSPVLKQGETWTHVVYILPLKQDLVNIKVRIIPSHTKKFKQEVKNDTILSIASPTYVKRDVLFVSVFFIIELLVFLFVFSILWSHFIYFISEILETQAIIPASTINIPWLTLLIIGLIELIVFIPFLFIMYILQKRNLPFEAPEELAFSRDIRTHLYDTKEFALQLNINVLKSLFFLGIALTSLSFSIYLTTLYREIDQIVPSGFEVIESVAPLLFGFLLIIVWVITLRLVSNVYEYLNPWGARVSETNFVETVKSTSQMQISKPNTIMVRVKNVLTTPGIRIVFKGSDSISPQMVELHLEPGEVGIFKLGITPMQKGIHDILVVLYPLFDHSGEYINLDLTQPVTYQNIEYKVLGETIIGITKTQAKTLKHLLGWGSLIASTLSIANQYFDIQELLIQWRETIPWLVTLQVPFVYLYYLFSNRFITHIRAF
jgi:hypothetical protein